jgi:hypothetical protein
MSGHRALIWAARCPMDIGLLAHKEYNLGFLEVAGPGEPGGGERFL